MNGKDIFIIFAYFFTIFLYLRTAVKRKDDISLMFYSVRQKRVRFVLLIAEGLAIALWTFFLVIRVIHFREIYGAEAV